MLIIAFVMLSTSIYFCKATGPQYSVVDNSRLHGLETNEDVFIPFESETSTYSKEFSSTFDLQPFQKDAEEYFSHSENIVTLYDSFNDSAKNFAKKNYLQAKVASTSVVKRFFRRMFTLPVLSYFASSLSPNPFVYKWKTYAEIKELVDLVASNMMDRLKIKKGSRVCIHLPNSMEWIILDHACCKTGAISVPISARATKDYIEDVLDEIELDVLFTTKKGYETFLLFKTLPFKYVIILCDTDNFVYNSSRNTPVILPFKALYSKIHGPVNFPELSSKDIFTICFTSGTTGKPKGVVLTHGNMMSEMASLMKLSKAKKMIDFTSNLKHLSYMPLSHIFERLIQHSLVVCGATSGFFSDDIKQLVTYVAKFKPTIFLVVPKVLDAIRTATIEKFSKMSYVKKVFDEQLNAKIAKIERGDYSNTLLQSLLFGMIKKKLGGKVQAIVSGSAKLDAEVMRFIQATICPVYQGYGQTETCGGSTVTWIEDIEAGHIGGVMPGITAVLKRSKKFLESFGTVRNVLTEDSSNTVTVEIPDKNQDKGELCFKGPNIFQYYYNSSGTNAQSTHLDDDGWYCTGDVVSVSKNGSFMFHSRLGDIVKGENGEYLSLSDIEIKIASHDLFKSIAVVYDSAKKCLQAVVVLKENVSTNKQFQAIVQEKIKSISMEANNSDGKSGKSKKNLLKKFETPVEFYQFSEPFSTENQFLTDTAKIRRSYVKDYINSSSLIQQVVNK